MESQPQNPEFRNNPENFHTCKKSQSLPSNLNFFRNRAVNKQRVNPYLQIWTSSKTEL